MYIKHLLTQNLDKSQKLFPQIQLITLSKVVNYFSLDIHQNTNQWAHHPSFFHKEHMLAQSLLQTNFKNHIVDWSGLKRMNKLIQQMEMLGHSDLVENYFPKKGKKMDRKKVFIMGNSGDFSIEKLSEIRIMTEPEIEKVICFDRQKPIQPNKSIERFCHENNIHGFPLTNFTTKSLIKQIFRQSTMPILIHETILGKQDFLISEEASPEIKLKYKCMPENILVFCNRVPQIRPNKNFITFPQFTKNYVSRIYESETTTPNFAIKRFQRLDEVIKYRSSIVMEEGVQENHKGKPN